MNYIPLPPATIIMTFHSEGIYAHKSLLGFQRIRNYSTAKGNRLDLICILDDAENFTTKIVNISMVVVQIRLLRRVGDLCLRLGILE